MKALSPLVLEGAMVPWSNGPNKRGPKREDSFFARSELTPTQLKAKGSKKGPQLHELMEPSAVRADLLL